MRETKVFLATFAAMTVTRVVVRDYMASSEAERIRQLARAWLPGEAPNESLVRLIEALPATIVAFTGALAPSLVALAAYLLTGE